MRMTRESYIKLTTRTVGTVIEFVSGYLLTVPLEGPFYLLPQEVHDDRIRQIRLCFSMIGGAIGFLVGYVLTVKPRPRTVFHRLPESK
jgi:hypothetical protein